MKIKYLFVAAAFIFFAAKPAHAQVLFELSPAQYTLRAGQMATFSATLKNTGNAEIFLNSTSVGPSGGNVTVGSGKFDNSAPLSLQPGESWSGEALDVFVSSNALPQTYIGAFSLLGGVDSDARDLLTESRFTINIVGSSVPEPGIWAWVGAGTLAITGCWIGIRRKRQTIGFRRKGR